MYNSHSLSRLVKPSTFARLKRRLLSSTPPPPPSSNAKLATPVTWKTLGAVCLTSFALVTYYQIEKEKVLTSSTIDPHTGNLKVESVGTPNLGGRWALIDAQTGKFVTDKDFVGDVSSDDKLKKFSMMYFGFCSCPDICPSELRKVGIALDTIKPAISSLITPLFITVDPSRDSLHKLNVLAKDFHPQVKYLSGSPLLIKEAAKLYRVYVSKADETDDGDYLVDHSIVLYFNGPSGEKEPAKFMDFFTQSMKVRDLVRRVEGHVNSN